MHELYKFHLISIKITGLLIHPNNFLKVEVGQRYERIDDTEELVNEIIYNGVGLNN